MTFFWVIDPQNFNKKSWKYLKTWLIIDSK
jgi:hypothetical protein